MQDVLKVKDWLIREQIKPFQFITQYNPDNFERLAKRLKDNIVFSTGEKVMLNLSNGYVLAIYYFDVDWIHFVMENGERWKANNVHKL